MNPFPLTKCYHFNHKCVCNFVTTIYRLVTDVQKCLLFLRDFIQFVLPYIRTNYKCDCVIIFNCILYQSTVSIYCINLLNTVSIYWIVVQYNVYYLLYTKLYLTKLTSFTIVYATQYLYIYQSSYCWVACLPDYVTINWVNQLFAICNIYILLRDAIYALFYCISNCT